MQAKLTSINQSLNLARPDLLAPAGNWECAKAAVENGADAIYFGLDKFNARMRAENFTEADLPALMAYLHSRGVKGYVTLNTLIFPQELREAQRYLRSMMRSGVDALIVQDIGICRLIRHLSPDFPIHASTQMTITSAVGVEFAQELGCNLVVLARECSLTEINKIQSQMGERGTSLPLEVFVHGALCVAYSGQCLTSEALGGRSANRGECAQACRMPYDLIVDGQVKPLGDKKYLLSPQDLAGLSVLPELVKSGVTCLKIEGRLKAPEYVANVTKVYRQALDRVMETLNPAINPAINQTLKNQEFSTPSEDTPSEDIYNLEMAFSRGLYSGWLAGINNQELVHARFGKKRGVYLGQVTGIGRDQVIVKLIAPLQAGDGVVFDSGHPEVREEGGRVYRVESAGKEKGKGKGKEKQQEQESIISFGRDHINWRRVNIGDRLWKTSDPELDRKIRQSYEGDVPKFPRPVDIEVHGRVGEKLVAIARDLSGHVAMVESENCLEAAHSKPLTTTKLSEQLGRLGNTPFKLGELHNYLEGNGIIPVSELNRIRRELVGNLLEQKQKPRLWQINEQASLSELLPKLQQGETELQATTPQTNLIVLVRNLDQLQAILADGVKSKTIKTIYCEFEDQRKYKQAVQIVRQANHQANNQTVEIFVAPPRITKPGENWILEQVRQSGADGYLVRNYDQLRYFAKDRCVGDFSLNIANPLTADYLKHRFGLERLTASYDLNIDQLVDLLSTSPPSWYEVTIHQHMPMFHMEHCVFCAFLSDGKDFRDCGRPCETHQVKLRDRVGSEHVLQADVGCRNTVFNATAQTGAEYVSQLMGMGLQHLRIEFLDESPEQVRQVIANYLQLIDGSITGSQVWRNLKLHNQLGVTRGTVTN